MASKKDKFFLSYEDTLLRYSDFKLLDIGNWINDNIISFWFSYLHNQFNSKNYDFLLMCPEMSQFFKSAQQSKDMFNELKEILSDELYSNKNVFFFPINDCDFDEFGGNHWSLLVFYKNRTENFKFEHYDSSNGSSNIESAKIVAKILFELFCENGEKTLKTEKIDIIEMTCVKQVNGYDCGIHVLCNVEALIGQLYLNRKENLIELANLNVIKSKREQIKNTIHDLKSKKT